MSYVACGQQSALIALLIVEWEFVANLLSTVPQRERTEEVCAEIEGWHREGRGETVDYTRQTYMRILLFSSSLYFQSHMVLCSVMETTHFLTSFLETGLDRDPGVPRHHVA
jgi:hypothetical protein